MSNDKWEGAEEWMPLAWELCANECGEDACTELVWEGGPIPEPWGDRWLKYEDQAREMIAMVRKHVPAPAAPAPLTDAELDAVWARDCDTGGRRANFRRGYRYAVQQLTAAPAAPAPAKPLTGDQIQDLWAGASDPESAEVSIYELARAIERAHGIAASKGEQA